MRMPQDMTCTVRRFECPKALLAPIHATGGGGGGLVVFQRLCLPARRGACVCAPRETQATGRMDASVLFCTTTVPLLPIDLVHGSRTFCAGSWRAASADVPVRSSSISVLFPFVLPRSIAVFHAVRSGGYAWDLFSAKVKNGAA